jgi:hypothetical protein
MVAFIGFGGGGGFSLGASGGFGFGQIGWVPLAPFETYHPWWGNRYGYGYGYGGPTVVNSVVNINVTAYRNIQYNAVTSVTSERFIQGNFAHPVAVAPAALVSARVFRGALPVVPTESNLRFSASVAAPGVGVRAAFVQRSFAGSAAVVTRTPFAAQRVALAGATHAAITPLHFQDAQTTPLASARPLGTAPAAGTRVPAAGAPASAWSRFNATRTPESDERGTAAVPGAGHAPVTVDDRTQSAATTDHALTHPAAAADATSDTPRSYQSTGSTRSDDPESGPYHSAASYERPVHAVHAAPTRHGAGGKASPHPAGTAHPEHQG